MKKAVLILAVSVAVLLATVAVVLAAPGLELLQVFEPEPMVSCCGIGIDYDGSKILYTHYGDRRIHFTDLTGADLGALNLVNPDSTPFTGDGMNAIAYNFDDGYLYGGGWASSNLYKVDMTTGVTTLVKANALNSGSGFIDGLAWDPRDNTFWMSNDVACYIAHLDINGDTIGSFDGCTATGYGNSGLAVGIDGTLFYGTNGYAKIYALDTTTDPPTNLGVFASPGGRDEDMVCGPKFTKSDGTEVETLLSQDAYDNWFKVIEVAPNTCVSPASNNAPVANPNGPYLGAINTAIAFDGAASSDPDGDTLTFDWVWGDGSSSANVGATPTHSYSVPGIYNVCLAVTDPGGLSHSACTSVVVYDSAGGFVTGGGWIESPPGAYIADPSLSGRANFGFVSKYQKNASVPTGQTEFMFQAGSLNFHSSTYEWLVITGSNFARFKGSGTIDGTGDYKFLLWAGDGAPDTFRIRIWEEDALGNETTVYDNGFDQAVSGGSIIVHSAKK